MNGTKHEARRGVGMEWEGVEWGGNEGIEWERL